MGDEHVPVRFRPALEEIVRRLAAGEYEGVARDHSPHHGRNGHDLGMWVRDYPDELVPLPPEAWTTSSAGRVDGEDDVWWVIVDLWGAAKGRTDLSLEATVRSASTSVIVEIDDLHVM